MPREPDSARGPAQDLGQAFVRAEREALDLVFEHVMPRLFAAAMRRVRNPADAEDLVQDTLVTALDLRARYDPQRPLMPWLYGILNQLARRRRHLTLPLTEADAAIAAAGPRDHAQLADLRTLVTAALQRLTPTQREVVSLRLFWEMTAAEIAAVIERPEATVRVQLHRGLKALRRTLPRGIAIAGVAALLGVRGRAAVVHGVRSRSPVGPTLESLGSTWSRAATSLAIGGAVIAALGAASWWFWPTAGTPPPIASARPDRPRTLARLSSEAPAGSITRLPVSSDAVAETAALDCTVAWQREGEPAAGIGIQLAPLGRDWDMEQRAIVTGGDGIAQFTGLIPGEYGVLVDRGPMLEVTIAAGERLTRRIDLPDGVDLRGQIVDDAGRGLAGARIWVGDRRFNQSLGAFVADADDQGRFTLRGLNADNTFSATAPGFAPAIPQPLDRPGLERLTLVRSVGSFRGVVRGPSGAPIADASIAVGTAAAGPRAAWNQSVREGLPLQVRSDAEGRFRIDDLPSALVTLRVMAPGLAPAHVQGMATADPAEREIHLRAGLRLAGRVIDGEGRPLRAATIQLEGLDSDLPLAVTAATDGSFRFDSVDPDYVELRAEYPGHRVHRQTLVTQPPGEQQLEIVLAAMSRLNGVLRDDAERPLAGWSLTARGVDNDAEFVTTDAEGHFSLVLPAAPPFDVFGHGPESETSLHLQHRDSLPNEPWILSVGSELLPSAFVRAVILDRQGRPAPINGVGMFAGRTSVDARIAHDFATGELRVGPVPPDEYDVVLMTCDAEVPQLVLGRHRLAPNQTLDLGEVRPQPHGVLDVTLRHELGADLRLAITRVISRGQAIFTRAGERQRAALLPGDYTLMVSGARFVWQQRLPFSIAAGATTTLEIDLRPAATRRVVLPWPMPVEFVGGPARLRIIDQDGLELGAARVTLRPGEPLRITLELPAGTNTIELETATVTLRGVVHVTDLSPGVGVERVPMVPVRER